MKPLTAKQERFCQELVIGKDQSEAYRLAFDAGKMKPKTITERACVLAKHPGIVTRLEELRAPMKEAAQKTRVEWIKKIEEYAFTDLITIEVRDRLSALTLYGKATGYLQEKHDKGSPLEEFGAECLMSLRKEIQARLASKGLLANAR